MIQLAPEKSRDPNAWMDQAACADLAKTWDYRKDGDPFYPVSSAPFAAMEGKKICAQCPVIEICYAHSQQEQSSRTYGTFGGLDQEERRHRRRMELRAERDERRQLGK